MDKCSATDAAAVSFYCTLSTVTVIVNRHLCFGEHLNENIKIEYGL